MKYIVSLFLLVILSPFYTQGESSWRIDDIRVEGNRTTSEDAIIINSGLKIGTHLSFPSSKVQQAIKKLLKEGVFYDIRVTSEVLDGKNLLLISLKEYLLLNEVQFEGLNNSEVSKLNKNYRINVLERYSPHTIAVATKEVKDFLFQKGFRKAMIETTALTDSLGGVSLSFDITKGSRYRVGSLDFYGNANFEKARLLKEINDSDKEEPFKSSKIYNHKEAFLPLRIIEVYKAKGYLDVLVDSIVVIEKENDVNFRVYVDEGTPYQIKEITFEGNTTFSSEELGTITKSLLNKKYDKKKLEEKLFFEEKRQDVTSLYLDHGFANFKLKFREVYLDDNELAIFVEVQEGRKYVFGKIDFKGNVRTKDKVLHQTVITTSGNQFSRSNVIISQQKLMQLDYFIPEDFDVEMNIDTLLKSVAITYVLKERISDRFLVSGGFDGRYLIGTLGFDFKNFELSDVFRKGAKWNPLPAGGGQHLSLKAQSDATNYYGISFLFEEPRLNNKRVGLSLSNDYAYYTDGEAGSLNLISSQVGLSHFPVKKNPFLRLSHQLNYRYYNPKDYTVFGFSNGFYNSLTYKASVEQRTTNNAYFPTKGHLAKVEGITTSPTSFLKKNIDLLSEQDKYRWLEYYKFKASFKHYLPLDKNNKTIIASTIGAGYLGRYNSSLNIVPFERFEMGGTGITNYSINANNIIGLRGYEAGALSSDGGDPIVLKFSVELRRKLLSFDKWMMTGHLFYENGNTFALGDNLDLNHASGIGSKLYIPLLGVVGIDCGWGFNRTDFDWKKPTVQFTIGIDVGDF